MTDYSLLQIKKAVDKLEDQRIHLVSLEDISVQIERQESTDRLVSLIESVSKQKRMASHLIDHLSRDSYIDDLIPRICLGRRQGHTTAIVEYIQNTLDEVIVVVPHATSISELERMLNLPIRQRSICQYKPNVTLMTQAHFKMYHELYMDKKPFIIFEQYTASSQFLKVNTRIKLSQRMLIVGN